LVLHAFKHAVVQIHIRRTRKKTMRLVANATHTIEQTLFHLFVTRTLPFGKPSGCQSSPVRTERHTHLVLIFGGKLAYLATGHNLLERMCCFDLFTHEVTDTFISREIIKKTSVNNSANAQL